MWGIAIAALGLSALFGAFLLRQTPAQAESTTLPENANDPAVIYIDQTAPYGCTLSGAVLISEIAQDPETGDFVRTVAYDITISYPTDDPPARFSGAPVVPIDQENALTRTGALGYEPGAGPLGIGAFQLGFRIVPPTNWAAADDANVTVEPILHQIDRADFWPEND